MSQFFDPVINDIMARSIEQTPAPATGLSDMLNRITRNPQMPYSRPAGTIRTMDFIDNNRNGIDDRDEPPPFGGIPSSPPVRLPPRPVSSIPAPGAGGVGSLLRPYDPMDTYAGLVQRGRATAPAPTVSPYAGVMDYLMTRPVYARGDRPETSILPSGGFAPQPVDLASPVEQMRGQYGRLQDQYRGFNEQVQSQVQDLLAQLQERMRPQFDPDEFRKQLVEELRPQDQLDALNKQIADLQAQLEAQRQAPAPGSPAPAPAPADTMTASAERFYQDMLRGGMNPVEALNETQKRYPGYRAGFKIEGPEQPRVPGVERGNVPYIPTEAPVTKTPPETADGSAVLQDLLGQLQRGEYSYGAAGAARDRGLITPEQHAVFTKAFNEYTGTAPGQRPFTAGQTVTAPAAPPAATPTPVRKPAPSTTGITDQAREEARLEAEEEARRRIESEAAARSRQAQLAQQRAAEEAARRARISTTGMTDQAREEARLEAEEAARRQSQEAARRAAAERARQVEQARAAEAARRAASERAAAQQAEQRAAAQRAAQEAARRAAQQRSAQQAAQRAAAERAAAQRAAQERAAQQRAAQQAAQRAAAQRASQQAAQRAAQERAQQIAQARAAQQRQAASVTSRTAPTVTPEMQRRIASARASGQLGRLANIR